MTAAAISQAGLAVLAAVQPGARITQGGLAVLGAVQPANGITQAGLGILARAAPCSASRCSLWSIERTDGVTLRFTSHDEDVTWGTETYQACSSLEESASEQSADASDIGSVDLQGIIDADAISEDDLYAGVYADAYVEVWRVSWDDPADTCFRATAGWLGNISHGESGWKGEVLGPAARMLQQAMLQVVAPTCRWRFGDPSTCGVDAEALAIVGTVLQAPTRAYLVADIIDPGGTAQWNRGKVRFTYGRNAGQVCEVRDVDFTTGVIVLWVRSGFTAEPGDSFDLLPGCDLGFDGGCTAYANKLRFGGFPHVPGTDAIRQTPEQKA